MSVKKRPDGVVEIVAPLRLGVFQDRLAATINFVWDIREQFADEGNARFVVDFSGCRAISRAACLIVTAELKRAKHLHGKRRGFDVRVYTPQDAGLATLFDTFGLYAYFNVKSPLTEKQRAIMRGQAIMVRSGGKTVEAAYRQIGEIAEVAAKVCHESHLAKAVDRALQEAMGNAEEHAYGENDDPPPDARWWFAGLFVPEEGEAYFYALDHGVGIPFRAQEVMGEELVAYWASNPGFSDAVAGNPSDGDRLQGAIRAVRSGKGDRLGRGKGLPYMVGLVDTAIDGEVRIVSGAASWHSKRPKKAPAVGSNTRDRCYPLSRSFPGTIVCWRITGSISRKAVVE